jgi:retron-type reverse transcriptase
MRNAETILNIIRQRGQCGLPVKDAYRLLYPRALYLRAYGKLYRNQGAMTPGSTAETVDGMSLEKINTMINALRAARYRWTPVRRTYGAKKNGKRWPLGLPTRSDKLLQEVSRSILEAYYEPQFRDRSRRSGLLRAISARVSTGSILRSSPASCKSAATITAFDA